MSYVLLITSFLLALFGAFYKSTKTDENGNVIQSKRGVPELTNVGKVVISLLVLSFLVSFYVTWDTSSEASQREEKLNLQLNKVQEQNAVLQKEITRALNPIKDVQLSFNIRVPLARPEMESYRDRLDKEYAEFVDDGEDVMMVTPLKTSELPDGTSINEIFAYMYFDRTYVAVEIYKAPVSEKKQADLSFSIFCGLDSTPYSQESQDCFGKMSLTYEHPMNSITHLHLRTWPVKADSNNWKSNGRIAAVSDLAGATLVVRFNPPGVGASLEQLQRSAEIRFVELKISGRTFTFPTKELKRTMDKRGLIAYVSTFSPTIE